MGHDPTKAGTCTHFSRYFQTLGNHLFFFSGVSPMPQKNFVFSAINCSVGQ